MLNSPCYVWCFYLLLRPVWYTIGVHDGSWQRWFFFLFGWLLRACLTLWRYLAVEMSHSLLSPMWMWLTVAPVFSQYPLAVFSVSCPVSSQSPIDLVQFPGPGMTPGMLYWAIGHLVINPNSAQFGSSGLTGSSNWPLPIEGSLQPWCLYFLLFYSFLCPPHCWAWSGSSNLQ